MVQHVLWPDKYDCLDLAINDYFPNPQSFRQEMQNDVTKVGERAFHMLKTMPAEEIEANTFNLSILAIDPAVETGAHNDFTALAVAGKTDNNFEWIRKGIIERLSFDQYINKVIDLLENYEDISYVWVEKNTFSGADVREIRQRIAEHDTLKHMSGSPILKMLQKQKMTLHKRSASLRSAPCKSTRKIGKPF